MIKSIILYTKGTQSVKLDVLSESLSELLIEWEEVNKEYNRKGYKFTAASIMRICECEN